MSLTVLKESTHRVSSLIMDYMDEEPPWYDQVREIICSQLNLPTDIEFSYTDALEDVRLYYHLIYKSPQVERISQATILLLGEFHDDPLIIQSNGYLIDGLVSAESVLFSEGALCPEDNSEPISGLKREIILNNSAFPTSRDKLTVYGWDAIDTIHLYSEIEECRRRRAATKAKEEAPYTGKPRGSIIDDLDEVSKMERSAREQIEVLRWPISVYSMFPQRTAAMVESLKQLEQRRAEGMLQGKAFYRAGLQHLYCPQLLQNSKLSLKSLYKALRSLPAIVLCTTRCMERYKAESSAYISMYFPLYRDHQVRRS